MVVFRGCTDQSDSADIDILQQCVEVRSLTGYLLEWVKVAYHHVDKRYAIFFDVVEILVEMPPG